MNIKILFFTLFFSLVSFFVLAQGGMIKGFVYDNSNGEPIGYASVQLQGTNYGGLSERNGAFIINKIPEGKYVVLVSFFGFNNIIDTIILSVNSTITKKYQLIPTAVSLEAVQVSAEGQRNIQETRTSVISVTPKEMSKMPAIGGQPDFAQYLQVLPGIVSTGDQGGQLYVRGGTPIQNMLLLDGMLVFNPFHSIGLFSVFDSDIINNADVYTGGFGADFGGRISSVMDIQTRDGNKKRTSGKIDLNTFGAKLLLEGPIVKLKNKRKASLSYILSAKGSYLEQSCKFFYPYVSEGLPYNYLDFYGKISVVAVNGTKINFFGFHFDDNVNYSSIASYNWNNWGLGTNFLIIPGEAPTTIEGTISYSNYITSLDEKVQAFSSRQSTMSGFNANLKFNYYIGKSIFNIGFDILGFKTDYIVGSESLITDYSTDIGLFIKYKYNFKNIVIIEPSFRLQSYISLSTSSPEPRLAIKYNITKKIRLKFAAGLYSQNYVAITSDRDVVNLFYGFLSSPDSYMLPDEFEGKEKSNTLQKAQHVVLGLELDLIKHTKINIEGYYKNFSQLIGVNRYQIYEDNQYYSDIDDIYKKDFLWEKGYAYGGDVTVKFEYKKLYFWGTYSLGWVKRNDGVVSYNPHFDRRHNVNLLLSYAMGKRGSWQIDLRWNYGSGFPFTKTQAYYPHYTPTGGIGDDYITSNETLDFLLADLNGGRLPDYHRMDISLKKKFFIGEHNTIDISVSATNIYSYNNIFYVNRATNDIIYQLPILYNVGLTWSF